MEEYIVKKSEKCTPINVAVPGSKSITNRALLLAALCTGVCELSGVLFSEDSRAFLQCLNALGFLMEIDERQKTVKVFGAGGSMIRERAELNVKSAGTAARFLTVMLAFVGGEYTVRSSEQMEKRPMQPLLSELKKAGVEFEFLKEPDHFPFVLRSKGIDADKMTVDTDVSSQFASAILMSGCFCKQNLTLSLTGNRTRGAYIQITEKMLGRFGVYYEKKGDTYYIYSRQKPRLRHYAIEPDFSAAGYFFAAGALLNRPVCVEGVHLSMMQGDKKLLDVLSDMGATVTQQRDGITVRGNGKLKGVTVNMQDFSDQALTLAAIAPFAEGDTVIEGIGHIRKQECDRIHAMRVNLEAMGVDVEEREDGITIHPCKQTKPAKIKTFSDHRVAMSFAIAGLKTGNLTIEDPACTAKTFEDFFAQLERLY